VRRQGQFAGVEPPAGVLADVGADPGTGSASGTGSVGSAGPGASPLVSSVAPSARRSLRSRRTRTTQPTGTAAAKSHHYTAYAMCGPMLLWSGSGIRWGCLPFGSGEVAVSSR
jgi:hypothetical protein